MTITAIATTTPDPTPFSHNTRVDLAFVAREMGMDDLTQADLDAWIRSEGEKAIRHMAEAERLTSSVTNSAGYLAERCYAMAAYDGYSPDDVLAVAEALRQIATEEAE